MQILLNSDNNIEGDARLTEIVEAEVQRALGRFADRITRVEVHVNDSNSTVKSGGDDKRCQMEARLRGLPPISASHEAASLLEAIGGAAGKLDRAVKRRLGRIAGRKPPEPGSQSEP